MVETQKEREDRLRREATRTDGTDPNLGAVNSLPTGRTTQTETRTMETTRKEDKPLTEKIGDTLHETKEKAKDVVEPDRTEAERRGTVPPMTRTTTTKDVDWDKIQHPGMEPCDEPYGTRPVSELTPPPVVTDKADLAAVRMMEREKTDQQQMDRDRIMTEATPEAAAARAAMMSKESEAERMKTGAAATGAAMTSKETTKIETKEERERRMGAGAAVTGAALATGAAMKRNEPTRITPERPVTGTVVPPSTTTTTTKETTRITPVPTATTTPPVRTPVTMSERDRMHAEDPSVHPDWETQPQINAPRDVGIPTAEGQADAARLRAGQRRSDQAKEPRIDRRGGEYEVPAASGARTDMKDDRSMTQKVKDTAVGAKEKTKETARDAKEDVDRKI